MAQQARLGLEQFLELILPPEGDYFVEWNARRKNPKKNHYNQAHDNISDLAQAARRKCFEGEFDTWIAIGSFDGRRLGSTCKLKKALYIDIDCGEGKPYPDYKAAWQTLKSGLANAGLPFPTIAVMSGNGLHVYWVLNTAIDPDTWRRLAARLKAALISIKVDVDRKVTTDIARILRPPETINYKDRANPKQVRVIGYDLTRIYSAESLMLMLPPIEEADPDDLKPNRGKSQTDQEMAQAVSISDMTNGTDMGPFDSCPEHERVRLAKDMLDAISLPVYYDGYDNWLKVGAALHDASEGSEDPAEWKDLWDCWSRQSAKYDMDMLDDKWEARFPDMTEISIGSLVYLAKEHGFVFPNALRSVSYPPGYIATTFGTVREPDEGEEEVSYVMSGHLKDVQVAYHYGEGFVYTAKVYSPKAKRETELRTSTASFNGSGADFGRELGAAGITIKNPRHRQELVRFMESFLEQIASTRNGISDTVDTFGWVQRDKRAGFATGSKVYWDDHSTSETVSVPFEFRTIYTPQGSLTTWQNVVQPLVDQGRQEIATGVASAFAAPLMRFTSITGLVLSLVSRDSGTGKSTALKAAQSVWGRPKDGINALDDTVNAVTKRLEILQNLPAYWDEVRMQNQNRDFIKMLFQLSQGKGKSRMNAAAMLQHTGTWNTMIVVAGNESLHEHIEAMVSSTNAGTMRLLELKVQPSPMTGALAKAMAKFDMLEHTYGAAGAIYARWLAEHVDEARRIVAQLMDRFDKMLKPRNDERFWLAAIAALVGGATIANNLGLLKFDLAELAKYLVLEFRRHRNIAGDNSASSVAVRTVRRFLTDFKGHSITTDYTLPPKRGRPMRNDIHWPAALTNIRPPLAYQRGNDNLLAIDLYQFKGWLRRKEMSSSSIVETLKSMGVQEGRVTLGIGTSEAGPRVRGLIVDMRVAPFDSLF